MTVTDPVVGAPLTAPPQVYPSRLAAALDAPSWRGWCPPGWRPVARYLSGAGWGLAWAVLPGATPPPPAQVYTPKPVTAPPADAAEAAALVMTPERAALCLAILQHLADEPGSGTGATARAVGTDPKGREIRLLVWRLAEKRYITVMKFKTGYQLTLTEKGARRAA